MGLRRLLRIIAECRARALSGSRTCVGILHRGDAESPTGWITCRCHFCRRIHASLPTGFRHHAGNEIYGRVLGRHGIVGFRAGLSYSDHFPATLWSCRQHSWRFERRGFRRAVTSDDRVDGNPSPWRVAKNDRLGSERPNFGRGLCRKRWPASAIARIILQRKPHLH